MRIHRTAIFVMLLYLPAGIAWSQLDDDGIPPGAELSVLNESAAESSAQEMASAAILPSETIAMEEYVEYPACDAGCVAGGCEPCCSPCCAGPAGRVWVRGEYLLWWTKGMDAPPLVSTGTTGVVGVLGNTVLYGDDPILQTAQSGFRVSGGTWLDCGRRWALEGDYWQLGEETERFFRESNTNGTPSIFRPYFDLTPRDSSGNLMTPREAAQVVAAPGRAFGFIEVDSSTELYGAGIRLRKNLCCGSGEILFGDPCRTQYVIPSHWRTDVLLGYRYVGLRDNLRIHERVNSLLGPPANGSFDIADQFTTANDFHGADIGVSWEAARGRWSMELLGQLALGSVTQRVQIGARTTTIGSSPPNVGGVETGGLLGLDSNIERYRRNEFTVVPQLGVTVGYRLTPRLQATLGYSFLYLSRVVRPGDQIDREIASDQLPPVEITFAGPNRPAFEFAATDYWAQGINAGIQYSW